MEELINGSHQSDLAGYFEWWYFHFTTKNGIAVNVVLHETDIFGLVKSPYVSMSIHGIGDCPQYHRLDLDGGVIKRTTLELEVFGDLFCEGKERMSVNLKFPSQAILRVTITKLALPLIFNNGVLFEDIISGRKSFWVAQVPLGKFEGVLELKGRQHRLQGIVYQDHQWGNIPIQHFVSDWVWGHFGWHKEGLVFFAVRTQDNRQIERFALISDGKMQAQPTTKNMGASHLAELSRADAPEKYNYRPLIKFPDGAQFLIDARPSNIMRKRLGEKHQGFTASYLRWASLAVSVKSPRSKYLPGITEYLRIRKGR